MTDSPYWKAMAKGLHCEPSPAKPCPRCGMPTPRKVCLGCDNDDLRRELDKARELLRLVDASQIRTMLAKVPQGIWEAVQDEGPPRGRRIVTTSVYARRHQEKPEQVTFGIGTDHKKARDIAEFIAYAHMTLVTLGGRL